MLAPDGDPLTSKVSSWLTAMRAPFSHSSLFETFFAEKTRILWGWSHLRCYLFFVAPNSICTVVPLRSAVRCG